MEDAVEKNIEADPEQEDPLCSLFGTDSRFVRWVFFWLKVEEKTVTCSSQVLQRQRPPSEDNIKAPAWQASKPSNVFELFVEMPIQVPHLKGLVNN